VEANQAEGRAGTRRPGHFGCRRVRNVEAGFVYKTDAAVSRKVRIVYEVPIDKGPKITYPAAIMKESRHKDAARDFLNYIQSPTAKDAFKKYGFVVLD
jgi:molybdate transport system substrate-binding protein